MADPVYKSHSLPFPNNCEAVPFGKDLTYTQERIVKRFRDDLKLPPERACAQFQKAVAEEARKEEANKEVSSARFMHETNMEEVQRQDRFRSISARPGFKVENPYIQELIRQSAYQNNSMVDFSSPQVQAIRNLGPRTSAFALDWLKNAHLLGSSTPISKTSQYFEFLPLKDTPGFQRLSPDQKDQVAAAYLRGSGFTVDSSEFVHLAQFDERSPYLESTKTLYNHAANGKLLSALAVILSLPKAKQDPFHHLNDSWKSLILRLSTTGLTEAEEKALGTSAAPEERLTALRGFLGLLNEPSVMQWLASINVKDRPNEELAGILKSLLGAAAFDNKSELYKRVEYFKQVIPTRFFQNAPLDLKLRAIDLAEVPPVKSPEGRSIEIRTIVAETLNRLNPFVWKDSKFLDLYLQPFEKVLGLHLATTGHTMVPKRSVLKAFEGSTTLVQRLEDHLAALQGGDTFPFTFPLRTAGASFNASSLLIQNLSSQSPVEYRSKVVREHDMFEHDGKTYRAKRLQVTYADGTKLSVLVPLSDTAYPGYRLPPLPQVLDAFALLPSERRGRIEELRLIPEAHVSKRDVDQYAGAVNFIGTGTVGIYALPEIPKQLAYIKDELLKRSIAGLGLHEAGHIDQFKKLRLRLDNRAKFEGEPNLALSKEYKDAAARDAAAVSGYGEKDLDEDFAEMSVSYELAKLDPSGNSMKTLGLLLPNRKRFFDAHARTEKLN